MRFIDKYSTDKIKAEVIALDPKDKVEQAKTSLSDDAFAIGEVISQLFGEIKRQGGLR